MQIQPSGFLQRLIREAMRPFAKQYGFAFVKRTLLGRVHEDTLHIINFDVTNPDFNCTVAIQPLYVPAAFIALGLGSRLERMGPQVPGAWGSWGFGKNEDEIRRNLAQVRELLEAHALPWLVEVGNPGGIVSFIETMVRRRMPIWGLPAFLHHLYLGFSYLYIGQYEAGQRALAAAAETLSRNTRPWATEDRELADRMRILARDEPEKVPSTLQEFVRQTKANLRLK